MATTTATTEQYESIHFGRDGMRKAADYASLRAAAPWGTYMVESARYVLVQDLAAEVLTYMVLSAEQYVDAEANAEQLYMIGVYRAVWAD